MARRSYTQERIINELQEAEIFLSQGPTVGETTRKIEVTEQICYPSGRQYGG